LQALPWERINKKGISREVLIGILPRGKIEHIFSVLFGHYTQHSYNQKKDLLLLQRNFFQTLDHLYKYELISEDYFKSFCKQPLCYRFLTQNICQYLDLLGEEQGIRYLSISNNLLNGWYMSPFMNFLKCEFKIRYIHLQSYIRFFNYLKHFHLEIW
jgi:hypothetical protein